jgi:hypothetical protein
MAGGAAPEHNASRVGNASKVRGRRQTNVVAIVFPGWASGLLGIS